MKEYIWLDETTVMTEENWLKMLEIFKNLRPETFPLFLSPEDYAEYMEKISIGFVKDNEQQTED